MTNTTLHNHQTISSHDHDMKVELYLHDDGCIELTYDLNGDRNSVLSYDLDEALQHFTTLSPYTEDRLQSALAMIIMARIIPHDLKRKMRKFERIQERYNLYHSPEQIV